jgi:hypothetical protein
MQHVSAFFRQVAGMSTELLTATLFGKPNFSAASAT